MNWETSYRTVWLSDTHLGSRACRIGLLLDFLRRVRCRQLYLVGDIIDLKSLRRSFYWPTSHTEALRLILLLSEQGTRVTYIPGNHDDDFRKLSGTRFGNIEISRECVHTTASGRRLLVLHGDEFDTAIKCNPVLLSLGATAYALLLSINRLVHWTNDLLGRPYWSLAQHVKTRVGKAVSYADRFRTACVSAARDAGVDGVVCGHIHRAELRRQDGIMYCNDGDWVESCTVLVEDAKGRVALVAWAKAASSRDLVLSRAA